jgi:hypothetical protein
VVIDAPPVVVAVDGMVDAVSADVDVDSSITVPAVAGPPESADEHPPSRRAATIIVTRSLTTSKTRSHGREGVRAPQH